MSRTYTFRATLWRWRDGSWQFVTLPEDISDEIDERHGGDAGGFGSIRVEVTIAPTTWKTSLFPSKEQAAYVLPVKAAVRDAAGVSEGDHVTVELTVRA